ncbi:MAG: glutathione S-transferase family protein [Methylobacterium mesophilicum]|nr:glutathione S-transferase family protein [Methylobacterium mesophilicum]
MTILLYDLVGADAGRPFSPHCWKTAMALAHKGLDFQRVPTRFLDIPQVEGGISKTVPVIRDGDSKVIDSFTIALYLDQTYPDGPSLFGGPGGEAMARFIERWSQLTLHPFIVKAVVLDIFAMQDESNKTWFRPNREARLGKPLEEVAACRDAGLSAFRASLEPLCATLLYQPWIGGQSPLFADYIVFGAFQWARVTSAYRLLEEGDPVGEWFERCLGLYDGLGAATLAAAA